MPKEKLTGYPSIDKPWLKYYPKGAENIPIPEKTAYQFVYDKQKNNGDYIALNYLGKKISYAEVFKNIESCAKAFKTIGIGNNDIVTIALPMIPETVYIFYALNRIGAISNFIDPRLKPNDYISNINETNSKLLIATDMFFETICEVQNAINDLMVVLVSPFESASWVVKTLMMFKNKSRDSKDWDTFLKKGKSFNSTIDEKFENNKTVTIVHTGGTTGMPKGVMLTNENFNTMALTQEISGFEHAPKDTFLTFLPPFIAYCLVNAIHDPLYLGFENTLVPKFEYTDFPTLIMKYKPNHVLGGPILWDNFIKSDLTQNADLSFFKSPISGGDAMNVELELQINEFFITHNCNHKIQQGYGMTEVSAAACYSTDKSYCKGSVGIPYVKNIISVFDVETNEELKYGEEGEICIQTPTMMAGYYNNYTATAEVIKTHKDGSVWVHTGDCGTMNENGNLFIKGRMKRMIVRSGNKIFPSTVESIILKHPNISNCAVVQMPHTKERHVPIGYLVLNDKNIFENTIQELNELIGNELPAFNIPYKYVPVEELPLTNINKIDFRALEREAEHFQK